MCVPLCLAAAHPHNIALGRDEDNCNNVVGSKTMLTDHRSMAASSKAASGRYNGELPRDDKAPVGVDEEVLDGAKLDTSLGMDGWTIGSELGHKYQVLWRQQDLPLQDGYKC